MYGKLKPCPFCGRKPNPDWTDESYIECTNRKCSVCGYGMSTGDWNTRPIEDALNARIAELESLVEQLIWVGNDLLVSNTNPVTITLFNGLVNKRKE